MHDFVHTLQSTLAAAKPDFRDDDSVLGFLCSAYYDQNCTDDSEKIKQAFEELYEAMNCVRRCGTTAGPLKSDTLTAENRHPFRRSDSWRNWHGDRHDVSPHAVCFIP